jgi:NADPH-dependent curcumin reductase CurA
VDDDWQRTEEPVPVAAEGQAVVRVHHISLDPAMRGWMNEARSYIRPVAIGEVMRALCVGDVVESRNPRLAVGSTVTGAFGVQEYALTDGHGVSQIDTSLAPPEVFLGALGMPGLTAYFGLLEVGQPQPGDTVVVSAAAGAVGQVVGQVARIKGCRAIGIAGGPEKCRTLLEEFGFDAAIDYKHEDVRARLRELCPDRINVYFDNVGGEILDAALTRLARHARVVICGAVSQYNTNGGMRGPSHYMSLLVDRARMEGFVVFDYADRYADAVGQLATWRAEGRLRSREHVIEGFDRFPAALLTLFRGENHGKLVLAVG